MARRELQGELLARLFDLQRQRVRRITPEEKAVLARYVDDDSPVTI